MAGKFKYDEADGGEWKDGYWCERVKWQRGCPGCRFCKPPRAWGVHKRLKCPVCLQRRRPDQWTYNAKGVRHRWCKACLGFVERKRFRRRKRLLAQFPGETIPVTCWNPGNCHMEGKWLVRNGPDTGWTEERKKALGKVTWEP